MNHEVYLYTSPKRQWHLKCPACGAAAEGATGLSHSETHPVPKPGSMTICGTCGKLLVFIESFASYRTLDLRLATPAEEKRLSPEARRLFEIVKRAVRITKRNVKLG